VLRVGLTGGIGAGKSTVARRLADRGAVVVDADVVAREVVEPGTEGLAAVVEAFGSGVLDPAGRLDRAALARIVFPAEPARRRLDALLHPRIAVRTRELLAAAPADAVVVHDVPLLVENRMGAGYHLVLVVHAPPAERVRRLVAGRGMSEQDVLARVAAQADDDARRAAADVWLDNGGAPADVLAAVDALWTQRLVPFEAGVRARRAAGPTDVAVVEPDPTWPAQAARVVARVAVAAGGRARQVDHVGPTAVPGLVAQDVLDVQLVVDDLAAADHLRDALDGAGFARVEGAWWDETSDGRRHPKRRHGACDPGRPVAVHVREVASAAVREQLALRDWLRTHGDERDAFAALTRSGDRDGAVRVEDQPAPTPWMLDALRRAHAWDASRRAAPTSLE
jgi:dephospho-CoA kinase